MMIIPIPYPVSNKEFKERELKWKKYTDHFFNVLPLVLKKMPLVWLIVETLMLAISQFGISLLVPELRPTNIFEFLAILLVGLLSTAIPSIFVSFVISFLVYGRKLNKLNK